MDGMEDSVPSKPPEKLKSTINHDHHNSDQGDSMEGMDGMDSHSMHGFLGADPMTREASGTSWLPDATPHKGLHFMADQWSLMVHGFVNGALDRQDGGRGANKIFSTSMGMLMASRPVGQKGTLGVRTMFALDPLMGANGYPLLFATGETANGRSGLVDRQHPHDLFMELAGTYSYKLSDDASIFGYAGLPGEPALGPAVFMHRFSGIDNPEAPITHHWLDSTHVAFGVLTGGYIYKNWKIEGSAFNGREPDQYRYDIEAPKLDSFSTRLTYNPSDNWSLQTSWGSIRSPEQLAPDVNENRLTASATYQRSFGKNNWGTTFAWGRKMNNPGHDLDGFLLESTLVLYDTHTFFARAERVDEDELFEGDPVLDGKVLTVNKISLGYIRDFHPVSYAKFGVGGLVSRYDYPHSLDAAYGDNPTSFMLFVRAKI